MLEVLPDGFGFLRAPDSSYTAVTDDIYISPSQIRRFNLHTGDMIEGEVRTPKDGERYFALNKLDKINDGAPEDNKHKVMFENLTPLFPARADQAGARHQGRRKPDQPRSSTSSRPSARASAPCWWRRPSRGKTVMMQHIAHAIVANYPEVVHDGAAGR